LNGFRETEEVSIVDIEREDVSLLFKKWKTLIQKVLESRLSVTFF